MRIINKFFKNFKKKQKLLKKNILLILMFTSYGGPEEINTRPIYLFDKKPRRSNNSSIELSDDNNSDNNNSDDDNKKISIAYLFNDEDSNGRRSNSGIKLSEDNNTRTINDEEQYPYAENKNKKYLFDDNKEQYPYAESKNKKRNTRPIAYLFNDEDSNGRRSNSGIKLSEDNNTRTINDEEQYPYEKSKNKKYLFDDNKEQYPYAESKNKKRNTRPIAYLFNDEDSNGRRSNSGIKLSEDNNTRTINDEEQYPYEKSKNKKYLFDDNKEQYPYAESKNKKRNTRLINDEEQYPYKKSKNKKRNTRLINDEEQYPYKKSKNKKRNTRLINDEEQYPYAESKNKKRNTRPIAYLFNDEDSNGRRSNSGIKLSEDNNTRPINDEEQYPYEKSKNKKYLFDDNKEQYPYAESKNKKRNTRPINDEEQYPYEESYIDTKTIKEENKNLFYDEDSNGSIIDNTRTIEKKEIYIKKTIDKLEKEEFFNFLSNADKSVFNIQLYIMMLVNTCYYDQERIDINYYKQKEKEILNKNNLLYGTIKNFIENEKKNFDPDKNILYSSVKNIENEIILLPFLYYNGNDENNIINQETFIEKIISIFNILIKDYKNNDIYKDKNLTKEFYCLYSEIKKYIYNIEQYLLFINFSDITDDLGNWKKTFFHILHQISIGKQDNTFKNNIVLTKEEKSVLYQYRTLHKFKKNKFNFLPLSQEEKNTMQKEVDTINKDTQNVTIFTDETLNILKSLKSQKIKLEKKKYDNFTKNLIEENNKYTKYEYEI